MRLSSLWSRPVSFGRRAEIRGAEYLRRLGYKLLASPYRGLRGEVDIVARDGECLAFVEVKARRRDAHPEDAVNRQKQTRILSAAREYRKRCGAVNVPYRFDVLAVIEPDGRDPEYRLIQDAFRDRTHRP